MRDWRRLAMPPATLISGSCRHLQLHIQSCRLDTRVQSSAILLFFVLSQVLWPLEHGEVLAVGTRDFLIDGSRDSLDTLQLDGHLFAELCNSVRQFWWKNREITARDSFM